MTKPDKEQWIIVVGFVWNGEAIDDSRTLRTGVYYTNTSGKANTAFAEEFANGKFEDVYLKYFIECGENEPVVSPVTYCDQETGAVTREPPPSPEPKHVWADPADKRRMYMQAVHPQ